MPTFYIDETAFTGEDLLAVDQPIFVQATTDYDAAEAQGEEKTRICKVPEGKFDFLARRSAETTSS